MVNEKKYLLPNFSHSSAFIGGRIFVTAASSEDGSRSYSPAVGDSSSAKVVTGGHTTDLSDQAMAKKEDTTSNPTSLSHNHHENGNALVTATAGDQQVVTTCSAPIMHSAECPRRQQTHPNSPRGQASVVTASGHVLVPAATVTKQESFEIISSSAVTRMASSNQVVDIRDFGPNHHNVKYETQM